MNTLNAFFKPHSVAVIGASRDESSVGYGVLKSLVKGCVKPSPYAKSFPGKVFAVNPHAQSILGKKCVGSVLDVPGSVDLAIVCVPAAAVNKVAEECGRKGVKAIIVVSAGFAESGNNTAQGKLVNICRKHGMRLLGPNCMGVLRPASRLNASFALSVPKKGSVAFVSQSGAMADSVIDWALQEKYAFSLIASLGNSADVDAVDLLEWLEKDEETKAIALYVESISRGKKFLEAAKRISKKKSIVVVKGGKSSEGSAAASSHTGALASDYKVFSGAMKQAGAVVAESMEELFDFALALSNHPKPKGKIAIVTNGGGAGVLAADYCSEFRVPLATLSEKTLRKLDESGKMHRAYSRRNPLDIVGDALPERYEAAANAVLEQQDVGGAIVVQTLQTMTDARSDAQIIVAAQKKFPQKPIIVVFLGGKYSAEGAKILQENGIAHYNDCRKAVRGMAALGKWL